MWLATSPAVELLEAVAGPGDGVRMYHDFGFKHWDDAGGPAERAATDRWLDGLDEGTVFYGLMHAPRGFRDAVVERGFEHRQEDAEVEWRAALRGVGTVQFVWEAARAGWELAGGDEEEGGEGGEPPDWARGLRVPAARDLAGRAWLDRAVPGWRRGAPVAFACNGGSGLKVFKPERLAAVMDVVLRRTGGHVVLVAGPDDRRAARVLAAVREPGRVAVLGPEHLLTTAGVLRRCRGLVSNDSGLLHMGGALGLPLVGVFGPTRAVLYMPRVAGASGGTGEASGARGRAVEPTTGSACCPLREPAGLGPPACIAEGSCRLEPSRCIDEVRTLAVARAVLETFGLPRRPAFGTGPPPRDADADVAPSPPRPDARYTPTHRPHPRVRR